MSSESKASKSAVLDSLMATKTARSTLVMLEFPVEVGQTK